MTKSELKSGYIVHLRCNKRYIVIKTTQGIILKGAGASWNSLSNYNEDLTHNSDHHRDIMSIYDITSIYNGCIYNDEHLRNLDNRFLKLVWDRYKMTFDEAVLLSETISHPALDDYYVPSKALELLSLQEYNLYDEMKKYIWRIKK